MRDLPFLAMAVAMASCSTVKVPQPMSGSKSDGVVSMAYEVGPMEKPVIDWNQVTASATARCNAWGYKSAEAFGGEKRTCNAYNGYGNCVAALVTIDYQCTN